MKLVQTLESRVLFSISVEATVATASPAAPLEAGEPTATVARIVVTADSASELDGVTLDVPNTNAVAGRSLITPNRATQGDSGLFSLEFVISGNGLAESTGALPAISLLTTQSVAGQQQHLVLVDTEEGEVTGVEVVPISDATARRIDVLIKDALTFQGSIGMQGPGDFGPRGETLRAISELVATVKGVQLGAAVSDLGKDIIQSSLAALRAIANGTLKPIIDKAIKDLKDLGKEAVKDLIDQIMTDYAVVITTGRSEIGGKIVDGTVVTLIDRNTGAVVVIVTGTITEADGTKRTVDASITGTTDGTTVELDLNSLKSQ